MVATIPTLVPRRGRAHRSPLAWLNRRFGVAPALFPEVTAVTPRSLQFVASACEGHLRGGLSERLVSRVCSDSRQVQPGDLFIALRGDRFDGHEFVEEVSRKGTVAALIERGRLTDPVSDCALIEVDDTRLALGRLAAAHRNEFSLPVVAVGGSNGKTTTKELIASVLRQRFTTLHSEASFNNDIGVPLTLLRLDEQHQAAVLEVGTNHPGELAPLVRMVRPRIGVITNIGREHLEFFGDLAGVAQEEGALAELLAPEGLLVLNGDDPWSVSLARRTKARVVRVGLGERNDWRALDVRMDDRGVVFRLDCPRPWLCGEFRLGLLGRHQVVNALLTIAVADALGLNGLEIQRGLAACRPAPMRLQLWEAGGVRVLDDTYNANTDSILAALATLMELPCTGRRIAVLGDMAEQGQHSIAAHEEVGRAAARSGIGQLIAVGRMAATTARAAREAGLLRVFEFPDVESAGAAISRFFKSGDLVLLKASRATRLERLGEIIRSAQQRETFSCFTT